MPALKSQANHSTKPLKGIEPLFPAYDDGILPLNHKGGKVRILWQFAQIIIYLAISSIIICSDYVIPPVELEGIEPSATSVQGKSPPQWKPHISTVPHPYKKRKSGWQDSNLHHKHPRLGGNLYPTP